MKLDRVLKLPDVWITAMCLMAGCLPLVKTARAAESKVTLRRTPNGGLQPQALVDQQGAVHLIYFKGKPEGGDLFYVRQEPGAEAFSQPWRINSQPGSAIAVGTIRGAQMALGRNGRVHVAWNGSARSGQHTGVPMLYTRLNDAGTSFEADRDLITYAAGLDGGGSVAADDAGDVYVVWHAPKSADEEEETNRAVFLARSTDDGKTFSRETPVPRKPEGVCACCGLRAFADRRGNLFVLYRAATDKLNRDQILLASRDRGASFEVLNSHPWKVAICPMSSAWLSESRSSVLARWETDAKIFLARVDPVTFKLSPPVSPATKAKCKHAVAASNARGDLLLAWAEGTGWQQGGAVAWELYGPDGDSLESGRAPGVPAWGLVAAVARSDGRFVIFF